MIRRKPSRRRRLRNGGVMVLAVGRATYPNDADGWGDTWAAVGAPVRQLPQAM